MKDIPSSTPRRVVSQDASEEVRSGAAVTCVLVVDRLGAPLMPTCPKRARLLLKKKQAKVVSKSPFVIRVLNRLGGALQPIELKLDPGSRTTGIALVVKGEKRGWFCIGAWELGHRGQDVRNGLLSRALLRRGRRSRKTRYREPRFDNRVRTTAAGQGKGWLAPSLQSRVGNVIAFARKILRFCPVSEIPVEQVRFDTQALDNPHTSGIQYQQGTLFGYEIREYLLEKWQRRCAYCKAQNLPLQIDHMVPRSRGGTDRVSNLTLACQSCNQKKANHPLEVFLEKKPALLRSLKAQARLPLKDAAAVNTTRIALVEQLQEAFAFDGKIKVSSWTGGRTKFNRQTQGYAKTHWLDAVCVGESGESVDISRITHVSIIQAKGRGSRQMCNPDKYGFPRTKAKSVKRVRGFQTGDRVRLNQPSGKYQGIHEGVISVRANGRFDIKTTKGLKITAKHDRFTLIQRFDGYVYSRQRAG